MSDSNDETPRSPLTPELRTRMKTLIFGSLIGAGAFQVASWNAQAHGNRSSHPNANVKWAVNDYVIKREALLSPEADTTRELAGLQSLADSVARRSETMKGAKSEELDALRKDSREFSERSDRLEEKLIITPTTSRAIAFIRNGETEESLRILTQGVSPAKALENVLWAQLDLNNLGMADGQSTAVYAKEIVGLTRAASKWYDGLAQGDRDQPAMKKGLASILFNAASFTAPDRGEVPADLRAFGREAAGRSLELRTQLGEPGPIQMAHWMVGLTALRAGDDAAAKKSFETSLKLAQEAKSFGEVAWSKLYLAQAIQGRDAKQAAKLTSEAEAAFRELGDQEGMAKVKQLSGAKP
jgi:hypothetical protein